MVVTGWRSANMRNMVGQSSVEPAGGQLDGGDGERHGRRVLPERDRSRGPITQQTLAAEYHGHTSADRAGPTSASMSIGAAPAAPIACNGLTSFTQIEGLITHDASPGRGASNSRTSVRR